MTWHEGFVSIGSIATAVIAVIILIQSFMLSKQTKELKTTNELAHSPKIVPRQNQNRQSNTVAVFKIENVGTASAVNIDIILKSSKDKQSIKIIALTPMQSFSIPSSIHPEERAPLLVADKGDVIKMDGTYENIKGDKIEIHDKFPVNEIFPVENNE